jgi:hypothetical protein
LWPSQGALPSRTFASAKVVASKSSDTRTSISR